MQSERGRGRGGDAKGLGLFPVEILDAGMAFELGPNVVVQRFRTCVDLLSVCASFFLSFLAQRFFNGFFLNKGEFLLCFSYLTVKAKNE